MKAIDILKEKLEYAKTELWLVEEANTEQLHLETKTELKEGIKDIEDALLILFGVGKALKKSIQQDFERWYLSEGYIETEKIGVYKNGCNVILHKNLFYKYVNDVKF